MALFTPFSGSSFDLPIFQLPPEYRNQTVSVEIFDPGDILGVGNVSMSIVDSTGTVGTASGIFSLGIQRSADDSDLTQICVMTPCPATFISTTVADGRLYNGAWVRVELKVPANYCTDADCISDPNRWWWYARYGTARGRRPTTF